MNRWIFALLFPLTCSAAVYDTLEIKRTTHHGITTVARVELTEKGFLYNGLPLPPLNTPVFAPALRTLKPVAGARHPSQVCRAGKVELTRTQGKRHSSERFCLEDKRSTEVHEALEVVKQQARLGLMLRQMK